MIERESRTLAGLVQEAGGWLHPELRICQSGRELSICSNLAPENREVLISLPEARLPVIAQFELAVEGDEFVIVSHEPGIDPLEVRLFEKTLEIYNLTRKLEWHRRTSIWLTLTAHPELIGRLVEARRGNRKIEKFHALSRSRDDQRLLIDTFLGTRAGQGRKKREGNSDVVERVLMPLIDFVNHSWQSPTFQNVDPENNAASCIAVANSKPVPGSDECYVLYNLLDALDTCLLYDFVEENAAFVRSVPIRIELPGGIEIEVLGSMGQLADKAALPAHVRDIWIYLPAPLDRTEKFFKVSSLVIPGNMAPFALRRVLTLLIQQMMPGITTQRHKDLVLEIEHKVIRKNLDFYEGLESSIKALDASGADSSQLARLIEVQRSKLRQYADRHQLTI